WRTIVVLISCFCVFDMIHTYVGGRGEGLSLPWTYVVIGVPEVWISYFVALALALHLSARFEFDLRRPSTGLPRVAGALAFTYLHILIVVCAPFIGLHPELTAVQRFFRVMRLNFSSDFLTYWALLGAAYTARHYSELQQRQVAEAQLEASLA